MASAARSAGSRELITAQEVVRPARNTNRTAILVICCCWHPIVAFLAIFLTNTNGFATPSYIQSNYAVPQTPEKTITVPYTAPQTTAPQTSGDLNVVIVGSNDLSAQVISVADSNGNSYRLAAGPTAGNELAQSIYYANNIQAAAANESI